MIAALEDRERDITASLLDYAEAEGFNVEAVRQALSERRPGGAATGVMPEMPEDPFVDQPLTGQHLAETLERLSRQIDSLTEFARATDSAAEHHPKSPGQSGGFLHRPGREREGE